MVSIVDSKPIFLYMYHRQVQGHPLKIQTESQHNNSISKCLSRGLLV